MYVEEPKFRGGAAGKVAVEQLGLLTKEREKTKRLLIAAACGLFCVAALVVVFAPADRQTMANILGAALLIMALGAIGATQMRIKVPGISVEASDGDLQTAMKNAADVGQIIQHQGRLDRDLPQ